MRAAVLLLALAALLAGCAARGDDPFAYMKKPLYASHFDLAGLREDTESFRVDDGSIAFVRVHVWINATAGGARVVVTNPSDDVVVDATETTTQSIPVELGAWRVRVIALEGSAGSVSVLATRATG